MPTVLKIKGYRFFFFSEEGKEPPHIHVESAEKYAKFWLNPLSLVQSWGFRSHEIAELLQLIKAHKQELEEKWHGFFSGEI